MVAIVTELTKLGAKVRAPAPRALCAHTHAACAMSSPQNITSSTSNHHRPKQQFCVHATTHTHVFVFAHTPPAPPQVEEGRAYCGITPPAAVKPSVAIDTYDDHRMAMAFSLVACGGVPVVIRDPGCTRKTFPTYFSVFESVVQH